MSRGLGTGARVGGFGEGLGGLGYGLVGGRWVERYRDGWRSGQFVGVGPFWG